MEDRYLYKAKRLNNGEWVQGYYVKGLDVYGKEVHLIFEPNTTERSCELYQGKI